MNKRPFVTREQVEEIVKTYPTPFHLYDEKGIRENAKALKEAFAWNPGFKEYFAVKGNSESVSDQYSAGVRMRVRLLLIHGTSDVRSSGGCRRRHYVFLK